MSALTPTQRRVLRILATGPARCSTSTAEAADDTPATVSTSAAERLGERGLVAFDRWDGRTCRASITAAGHYALLGIEDAP